MTKIFENDEIDENVDIIETKGFPKINSNNSNIVPNISAELKEHIKQKGFIWRNKICDMMEQNGLIWETNKIVIWETNKKG